MQKISLWLGLGLLAMQLAGPALCQVQTSPAVKSGIETNAIIAENRMPPLPTATARLDGGFTAVHAEESTAVTRADGGKPTAAARTSSDKTPVSTCRLKEKGISSGGSGPDSKLALSCIQQCGGDQLCQICCRCIARGGDPSQCCY